MNKTPWIGLALLAIVAGGLSGYLFSPKGSESSKPETALERVLRTGTLRCAYTLYPTYIDKDPNSGKLSGLFYDMTEALAANLGLNVEWGPEVGTHEIFEGFKNDAFDANCSGYWRTPERARGGDFSRPIVWTPVHLYVRASESRFEKESDLNAKNITFATLDGEATENLVDKIFPNAAKASLPGLTPVTDRFLSVESGKADVTYMDASTAASYMEANPNKIKRLEPSQAVVLPSVLVLKRGDDDLRRFLDVGIADMLATGELRAIVHRHPAFDAYALPASEASEAP